VRRVDALVRDRLGEIALSGDAGVVDDDVDATPRIERPGDERIGAFARRDAVGAGDGRTAGAGDLGDDRVGHRAAAIAEAVARTTEIVDHDPSAAGRELHGVRPPEAAARSGDDRDPVVETQFVGRGFVAHGLRRYEM
jgi:hypothetical protein